MQHFSCRLLLQLITEYHGIFKKMLQKMRLMYEITARLTSAAAAEEHNIALAGYFSNCNDKETFASWKH